MNKNGIGSVVLITISGFALLYAAYIAVHFAGQAPFEISPFRQTQTALTTFWLGKNGFSLAYETPVAGMPWSIPFEFPLYQYIVSLIARLFSFPLVAAGRLVSFAFLLLCLVPVRAITKLLRLSAPVFFIFVALLFSSPLYLIFGRAFLIETTALFFSIAAIRYFIEIMQGHAALSKSALFIVCISLGMLQKVTTGFPVLAILGLVYLVLNLQTLLSEPRVVNEFRTKFFFKKCAGAALYFGVPLVVALTWTIYTDHVRSLNGVGRVLQSNGMSAWNWGTLEQRMSLQLFLGVIRERIFNQNLSGILGIGILLCAMVYGRNKLDRFVISVAMALGLLPLFLFTNLHIVHDYYQVSCVIFLIFAVAVCLGQILENRIKNIFVVALVAALMTANNYYCWVNAQYPQMLDYQINLENSDDLSIATMLKKNVAADHYFIAFGKDWDSTLSFLSERKSFTVPRFFPEYQAISGHPETFIPEEQLGAIVICGDAVPLILPRIKQWATHNRIWTMQQIRGCYVALPSKAPS